MCGSWTIGPFTVEVVKTRISFVTRARFAGVVRFGGTRWSPGSGLKRPVSSGRFTKVEHIERQDWVYQLLLRSEADFDDELHGWLNEAYEVGQPHTEVPFGAVSHDVSTNEGSPFSDLSGSVTTRGRRHLILLTSFGLLWFGSCSGWKR